MQHKNDQGNNQPHSSSNSPSKSTERNRNEKRYTSKTEKENEQRRPNFPVEGLVGKLRPVLADLANVEVVSSTTNDPLTSSHMKRRQKPYAKKYKCYYCKNRGHSASNTRREHLGFVQHERESGKYTLKSLFNDDGNIEHISHDLRQTALLDIIDANIVEMLRKQGTLITIEEEKQQKSKFKPKRSIQNCITTETTTTTKTNTNEILLSFDSFISEAIMLGDTLDTYLLSKHDGLFVSP